MRCTAASWSRSSVPDSGAMVASNEAADAHSAKAVSLMPISARACASERTAVLRASKSTSGFGYGRTQITSHFPTGPLVS